MVVILVGKETNEFHIPVTAVTAGPFKVLFARFLSCQSFLSSVDPTLREQKHGCPNLLESD